ncbi:NADH:flavin oxidoreductase/NADH oxidase [Peniophora sp. CONT]|nr:NADH:flavin oxidoreductase/NADH oxidase [Peniophora sp. CONT]
MFASPSSKLFQPIRVGNMQLAHRIVMNPMTRYRNTDDHVPTDLVIEYYSQRASTPGTLLVSAGVPIADKAGGHRNLPGIWNEAQIQQYKKVADAVHAKGSFIFMQIWALGLGAYPEVLAEKGYDYVSTSPIKLENRTSAPREITIDEIKEYVQLFAVAARNAVHHAGFDGVEIHGANGYLVDTFIQDVTNYRTDEYGGSIENRIRFADEVVDAVVEAVGPERAAIRLGPWQNKQGVGMADPVPTFKALVERIHSKHPDLAYIHVIEPEPDRVAYAPEVVRSNAFADEIRLPKPVLHAAAFTPETAREAAEQDGVLIGFGKLFVSNPDLPVRLQKGLALANPDHATFFTHSATGYTDYPFAEEASGSQPHRESESESVPHRA